MQDTRWHTLQGGIAREVRDDGTELAVISLWGKDQDGLTVGLATAIEPRRLEQHFDRTLGFATRDLERHGVR